GLLLVVHQSQQNHAEGGLHLGLGKQSVQGNLGVGVLFQLNDNAHALLAVGLVPQPGDALQTLVLHLIGNVLHQTRLVHLVGQLGDDDAGAAVAELLHLGAGPHLDVALTGGVGGPDARPAHDDTPGGEVGALDVLHQVVQGGVLVVQHADGGVNDLPLGVGRDVGGHAHGDDGRAVELQVG